MTRSVRGAIVCTAFLLSFRAIDGQELPGDLSRFTVSDDLGLSLESLYYAKRGLHAFIDREVQPTGLVGILRTGGSIGSFAVLNTTDLGKGFARISADVRDSYIIAEQSLRVYLPGTPLDYAFDVYNAAERVEVAISLWLGAQRVASFPTRRLPVPAGGEARVTAAGGLKLGESLPAGSYILKVAAATANSKGHGGVRAAVQMLSFDVRQASGRHS